VRICDSSQWQVSTRRWISLGVFFVFIAMALASTDKNDATYASPKDKARMDNSVQTNAAELSFTIKEFKKDLISTWKKNPMKAKLKYEGKIVNVTGTMGTRTFDEYDKGRFTHFELRGAGMDWAYCTPRAEEMAGFARIPMGTKMTLKCMLKSISICVNGLPVCPGDGDLSTKRLPKSVGFFGCSRVDQKIKPTAPGATGGTNMSKFELLKSEPVTEELTTKKLGRIVRKSLSKFSEKYEGRVVKLTGKVKSLAFSGGSDVGQGDVVRADLVVLRGLSKGIYCNFEPNKSQRVHLADFEVGKAVTVKARIGIANDKKLLFATCIAGK
jgi:hypothetical protein